MQVLLLEPVPSLGAPGELVKVRGGYARNYLVPQGKALVATPRNVKQFEHQKKIAEARRVLHVEEMRTLGDKIAKSKISFTMKAGPTGKLFGSVTSRMIADELSTQVDTVIERTRINLDGSIREAGDFVLEVKLHDDVNARVKVHVASEIVEEEVEETADEASETDATDDSEAEEV